MIFSNAPADADDSIPMPRIARSMIVSSERFFERLTLVASPAGALVITPPAPRAGYLYFTGPLPLRYAEDRGWPAPLPPGPWRESEPTEDAGAERAVPASAQPVAGTAIVAAQSAAANNATASVSAQTILHFIGELRGRNGGTSAQFEPAMPGDAAASSAGVSSQP